MLFYYALQLSLFISVSEIQTLKFCLDILVFEFQTKKLSEIQTVSKQNKTKLSEIQTSSDFRHSLYIITIVPDFWNLNCLKKQT